MEQEPLIRPPVAGADPSAPPADDPPPYEEPKADMSKLPKYSEVAGGHGYQGHQRRPDVAHPYQSSPHMHGYQGGYQGRYQQYMTGGAQPTAGMASRVYVHQPLPGGMRNVIQAAPPDYLGLSIFSLICCCCPIGIFALLQSLKTRDLVAAGNVAAAVETSRSARILNRVAIAIGTFVIAALVTGITVTIIASSSPND